MEMVQLDRIQSLRLKDAGMGSVWLGRADLKRSYRVGRPDSVGRAQKGVPYF